MSNVDVKLSLIEFFLKSVCSYPSLRSLTPKDPERFVVRVGSCGERDRTADKRESRDTGTATEQLTPGNCLCRLRH
jgi:hypothetical protein